MNIKKAFQAAIATNDRAAFLAAAAKYGVKPSAKLPYASCDGTRISKDEFQIFVESLSSFEITAEGTHDSIRSSASSRMTQKAETLAFLASDLVKCTFTEMYYAPTVYRIENDAWVFVSKNGTQADAVSWDEIQKLAGKNRLPLSDFSWLKDLEIEQLPT